MYINYKFICIFFIQKCFLAMSDAKFIFIKCSASKSFKYTHKHIVLKFIKIEIIMLMTMIIIIILLTREQICLEFIFLIFTMTFQEFSAIKTCFL